MDPLTVGAVAAVIAAVVGFFLGRMAGRTSGGSIAGAPARSASSSEADAAFRLALSRIGAYLRENVDGPLAAVSSSFQATGWTSTCRSMRSSSGPEMRWE